MASSSSSQPCPTTLAAGQKFASAVAAVAPEAPPSQLDDAGYLRRPSAGLTKRPPSAGLAKVGSTVIGSPNGGMPQDADAGAGRIRSASKIAASNSPAGKPPDSTKSSSSEASPEPSGPLLTVQRSWQEQQTLAVTQKKQFQTHVVAMNELLEAQAKGLLQTQVQVKGILAELEPEIRRRPQLLLQVGQLQQTQAQVAGVHQLLQTSLSNVHRTQNESQTVQLQCTQGQVSGMYSVLQAQNAQLQQTQMQVRDLQAFAGQARNEVQRVTKSHDARLQHTQDQVRQLQATVVQQQQVVQQQRAQDAHAHAQELQKRAATLSAAHAEVAILKQQLERDKEQMELEKASKTSDVQSQQCRELRQQGQKCSGGAVSESWHASDVEEMKRRIIDLETELTKLLTAEDSDDEDEEWV